MVAVIDFICIILFIYIAAIDIKKMIISNKVLTVLLPLAVIKQAVSAADIGVILASTAVIAAIFTALYYNTKDFIGGGDVKLIFVLSVWLGYPQIVVALYLAFIAGGVFAAGYLLFKRRRTVNKIAFAPFLTASAFISFLACDAVLNFWQMII